MNRKHGLLSVLCLALLGCSAETGQTSVSVPLYVAGADLENIDTEAAVFEVGRADLAFGPLYLCAGPQAGDFCETARLEWLDSVVVDAASTGSERAGTLSGVTGAVKSWMFDLGYSSQLGQDEAHASDAALELGASAVLDARATTNRGQFDVTVHVTLRQDGEGESGVPLIRRSRSDAFDHDVRENERGLLVRFDPATWFAAVDLTPYLAAEGCEAESAEFACQDDLELLCDEGGGVKEERTCPAGEVCLHGVGCTARLDLSEDPRVQAAIKAALSAGARPHFQWNYRP